MTTDTINRSDHLPIEGETQVPVREVLINEADDSMLRWGDPRGPQTQGWLRAQGIQPGENVRAVVVDKDGRIKSNQVVSTELGTFFRPSVDMSEIQDDDSVFPNEANIETVPRATVEELRRSMSSEYVDNRTVQMDQIMSDEEMGSLVERADSDEAYETVQALIDDERFQPVAGLHIGENQFAFSPVFRAHNRRYVVGYVRSDSGGDVKPRLFYESNSDGGWRATPGITPDGKISKGEFEGEQYGQYVQTTKLNESVAAMLDGLTRTESADKPEVDWDELAQLFPFGRSIREEGNSFENEVVFTMVGAPGMDAYLPGKGYKNIGAEKGREMLEFMKTPYGMEPDFSKAPLRQYRINHSMLGDSTVGVYAGELYGRTVEWHVANDAQGRIWVERLVLADGKTTDYGTNEEVILAGALNMKPVEYAQQTGGEEGVDYDALKGNYVDMRKTIDRMPWVKRYRAAKGI